METLIIDKYNVNEIQKFKSLETIRHIVVTKIGTEQFVKHSRGIKKNSKRKLNITRFLAYQNDWLQTEVHLHKLYLFMILHCVYCLRVVVLYFKLINYTIYTRRALFS
jgi:hypothetical protein